MLSSSAGRLARRYLPPAIEAGWAGGLRLAGWALRPARWARRWSPDMAARSIVVAPHPDDETIGAGGVAVLQRRAAAPLTAVIVTDGGASRAGGLPPAEMARRRAAEVATAADILGLGELIRLELPEGRWEEQEGRELLAPLLREAQIIYAPSCVDYHPEHLRVARLVASVLMPGQLVRVCELGVPLTPVLANLVVNIDEAAATKEQALAAFATQSGALAPMRRLARYRAALYGLPAVEVFWELPAEAYRRAIAAAQHPNAMRRFRGIRERPLSDPVAALFGFRARAALRLVATGDAWRKRERNRSMRHG